MTIEVVAASIDAMVAAFGSIDGITARRGWPEHNVALDLSGDAVLAIHAAGRPTARLCAPRAVRTTNADGVATVLYRYGWLTIPLQIDLWAPYRSRRDRLAEAVNAAAHPRLPHRSDLLLTASGHHDRPVNVDVGVGHATDDASGPGRGEWRMRWMASARTDVVGTATHPQFTEGRLVLTTEDGGVELVETTVTT